ncbi:hypothetical protein Taro_007647 [Colocasia esculenta]|uniref:Transcription termination factor MTEF18, mitochondrial n=1 Tax=Colocasia esculenta TaxID=4460 RepID=A0A843U4K3_COLES|nr:hypothetical protein [Colocasia esculenta]
MAFSACYWSRVFQGIAVVHLKAARIDEKMSFKCLTIMPECCTLVYQATTPSAATKASNLRKKSRFVTTATPYLGCSSADSTIGGSNAVEMLSLRVYTPLRWQYAQLFSCVGAAKFMVPETCGIPVRSRQPFRYSVGVSCVSIAPSWCKQGNLFVSTIKGAHDVLPAVITSAASMHPRKPRIPRVVLTEAQDALFEYLHSTRSMHFTDAEHISKNSPIFLQNLIAKVDDCQETGRALSKFLCYHPINEFEPFFESLGLKQSEIYLLLPRNFLFLSDDYVMLENFHVLCNYGVPRRKIGKMYKEAREIFRYGHGILSSKLAAYEELGLSAPTVIKLVACCPSLLIGGVHWDFLQVLEKLKDSGIEHDWLRCCLSEENTYHWDRMLKMLQFLNEMGCNKKNLGRLIREHPRFLFDESGKKIYVLVAMLLKMGISGTHILGLFFQYPQILDGNYVKNLWHTLHFLFQIGMTNGDVVSILCTHPQLLGSSLLKKPELVLLKLDVDSKKLCEVIKRNPHEISNLASKTKTGLTKVVGGNHVHEKTTFLLKLGFVENSDEMTVAQKKFRGRGDELQERFDCLVSAGLDYHDVASMVKEAPPMLNQRTDVLKEKIDYLVHNLGYPVETVLTFPTFLCYNIERIKLRFSMYKWLREKEAVKQALSLSTILAGSNARFLKYFIHLHPEGPNEWERLKKSLSSS